MRDKNGLPLEREERGSREQRRPSLGVLSGGSVRISVSQGGLNAQWGKKKPCLLWDYSQDKALCVCADIVSKVRGKKITFK